MNSGKDEKTIWTRLLLFDRFMIRIPRSMSILKNTDSDTLKLLH